MCAAFLALHFLYLRDLSQKTKAGKPWLRDAMAGDHLLFTKSLGTGVIATAIKQGTAKQSWIDAATRSMTTLNKVASEVIASCTTSRVGAGGRPLRYA